jgi:hypothetical protein
VKEYMVDFYKQIHVRGKILALNDDDLEEKMKSDESIMANLVFSEEKDVEIVHITIDEVKESEYYE